MSDRTTWVDQPRPNTPAQLGAKPDARLADADLVGGAASHHVRVVMLLALDTDPHFAPPLHQRSAPQVPSHAASRADGWVLFIVHTPEY